MLGDEPPDEDSLHSTFATFDPGCMVSELRSLSILTCVGRPRGLPTGLPDVAAARRHNFGKPKRVEGVTG